MYDDAGFRKLAADAPDGDWIIVHYSEKMNAKEIVLMLANRRGKRVTDAEQYAIASVGRRTFF